jgi:predicted NUDIX family NTP pyrophosphohydrolase
MVSQSKPVHAGGRRSAALLVHRPGEDGTVEVLLVHPGGPFWARRDDGAWSLPKGELEPDEEPLMAARREFREEVGIDAPAGTPIEMGEVKQPGGKRVVAWAVQGNVDLEGFSSNTFEMEWPRGSGRSVAFPEVDRAEWFSLAAARSKLLKAQVPFLDALAEIVSSASR